MKNRGNSLTSKKLRKLIVSYFSLSYLIFTIFTLVFFLVTVKGLIKESNIRDLSHRIELRKLLIEEWLRKSKDVSRQIASRTMIRKKLESFNDKLISYNDIKEYTEPKLKDAISRTKEINGIYRLSKKNELVASLSEIDFDKLKNFINLKSVKLRIHNPIRIENEFYIVINSPIKNKRNEIVGRDILLFNLYKLNSILRKKISQKMEGNLLLSYKDKDKRIFFTCTKNLSRNIKEVINDIQKSKISLDNSINTYKKHCILLTEINEGTNWELFFIVPESNIIRLIIKTFIPKIILLILILIIIILIFLLLTKPLTVKILLKTDELEKIVEEKTNSLKKEIEERKILEEKNRNLAFLKKAILESPLGIVVFALDKNYRYLDFTLLHKQTMKEIWGVEIEIGKNMLDFIKNERDRKKAKKNFDRALNGESFILIEKYGDKKLKRNYYENRYNPIYDENKNIMGLSVFVIDITEQKRIEKDLKNSEEKLSVTLRSIGEGVITTDVNGNIDFLNKTAERLTEWRTDEAKGKSLDKVFKIINEITRQKVENPVKRVLNEGRIIGLTNNTILISKTGKEYNIADSAAPILDAKSNIIGVVLVFRDVTEKLRLEQEQLKLKKLESIGILAGGIAHDFNNILTGLFGNLELARLKLSNKSPAFNYIQTAFTALERATKLTKQLLTFAKGGEPILENVNIKSIIKSNVEFNLSGSKIKPIFDFPDNIWEIMADKGQISQVISNLIINSKQAMPDGGKIYISVKNIKSIEKEGISHYKGKYVLITIKDEGIGISQKHIEKIFDPYFSTKQEGSGLGLAIVHSIISKHNGYISVESSIGKGTTFYIYLPASKPRKNNMIKRKRNKSENKKRNINILVMDDEEIIRDVASSMLNLLGYNVELAVNGEEAIDKYKAYMEKGKKFDLVIMDLTIPGAIGGKETIREIKKLDSSVKAIVSSGYSTDPVMSNYEKYGFKGKLLKPFQLSEVEEEIERVLNIK